MKFLHTFEGMTDPDPHLGSFKTIEGPIVMKTWGDSGGCTDMPLLEPMPPPDWVLDKWRMT